MSYSSSAGGGDGLGTGVETEVGEDALDDRGLVNEGDQTAAAATGGTTQDFESEHAVHELGPEIARGLAAAAVGASFRGGIGHDRVARVRGGREHAVVGQEVLGRLLLAIAPAQRMSGSSPGQERHELVQHLVQRVIELACHERERYLRDASGGDVELRREVEELLAMDIDPSEPGTDLRWMEITGGARQVQEPVGRELGPGLLRFGSSIPLN